MPPTKPPTESLEQVVGRMASGAASIVDEMREQTRVVKLVLTAKQFLVGMIVFVVTIIAAVGIMILALNASGKNRTNTTRRVTGDVVVAAVQCLIGGVPSPDLHKCVTGVLDGKPAPPPRAPTQ